MEAHGHSSRKPSEFTRLILQDIEGRTYDVTPSDYSDSPMFSSGNEQHRLLLQFIENELRKKTPGIGLPKHIRYMSEHDLLDYCEVSEKGHFSWYPKGVLIQRLILDYASKLARDWGAFEMRNPIIIRGDHDLVGQLMGEFHERDYRVDGGRGLCYLRYASDPLAFPYMQKVRITRKQSPLKVYEEASCFRNEQEGEVSGLKRVRGFLMTDMHAACSDANEAYLEYERLSIQFGALMDEITEHGRWVLGWEGTIDFFEENRDWLVGIGKKMRVPALFKLMPEMSHYYAIKNEYQFINQDGSNVQVSTVQWDVKDGQRFDIGYFDETGQKHPSPVIIHASSFGSIERAVCAILENIAIDEDQGKPAMFPFWLAPTQVRLLPVADAFLEHCRQLCSVMSEHDLRVDIDDRDATVGKKIRNGEKEWIPYLLVIGERETSSGCVTARSRADRSQMEMPLQAFIELARKQAAGKPFRALPLNRCVSERPLFH